MTNDSDAQRVHDAAVDAATEDETATAAAPAVTPREMRNAHDLAGLDVFPSDGAPKADVIAAEDNEEALDATRPRAAAVLLDADAAAHLAADPDVSAPARQLPIVRDPQPAPPAQIAEAPRGNEYAADEGDVAYDGEDEDEGDETVIAQATPRPRTLSAAFRPPRDEDAPPQEPHETPPLPRDERPPREARLPRKERFPRDATLPPFPAAMPLASEPEPEEAGDAIEDELDPEEEWAVADQPTIYMPPKRGSATSRPAPQQEGWPYRPQPGAGQGPGPGPGRVPSGPRPGIARPGVPLRRFAPIPAPRSGYEGPRLASPTGRPMPGTPPDGVSPAALADPRMERFQQLRESREAHEHGDRAPDEMQPVSEVVRRWWGDLLPGLRGALRHQHDAQASGVHPVSPYDAAPTSRLGDAFGRLTQSARDLTERARPALQRIHDQAEHAAQALVGRFEQPTAMQQAPFLGPGRVAIFFKSGVTVGQAHALLVRRQARPMRLIPRKHGFLVAVVPGREAEVCDGLRGHPYVRDVAYIAYDGDGQPMDEQEA